MSVSWLVHYDTAQGKPAVHMVSAWASANGLVLGQVKTEDIFCFGLRIKLCDAFDKV